VYFQRSIHQDIKKHLKIKEYIVITVPHQSGKTSLLQALPRELQNDQKQVNYLTFEDRNILSAVNTHPEEIFSFTPRPKKVLSGPPPGDEPFFLMIDEV